MALLASKRFRAVRTTGGQPIPTMKVNKASGITWPDGAVIIASSGLAVEGSDGPNTATILGVANGAEASSNTNTTAIITPALPEVVFKGQVATGSSGATASVTAANRYVGAGSAYDLAVNSSIWYINIGASSDDLVVITDLVDAASTAWGEVEFRFIDSIWNPK